MTKNNKKIEEIVEAFDTTMKKGFMSGLILLVIQKEASHGYKIQKEIEELTLGEFKPTSSNIYPLLESLKNKELIACIESDLTGRQKKIYEITQKGQDTVKMLVHKHQMMVESIKSIILSTLGITDVDNPSFLDELEKIMGGPLKAITTNSFEEKIVTLRYHKELLKKRMNMMSVNLEKSEEILLKMEAKFQESNGEHNLSSTEQIPNQNFTEDA
jgi:DNA-binding PadR family transcriptional regulator